MKDDPAYHSNLHPIIARQWRRLEVRRLTWMKQVSVVYTYRLVDVQEGQALKVV